MTPTPCIYLDSNVFIAAYEQDTARADHARWILDAIENGRIAATTSELTLAEILVKPVQIGAPEIVEAYKAIMQSGPLFDVLPVDRNILIESAHVRAERVSIRLPDAIHVATARRRGCVCIVTDDGGMSTQRGPPVTALGPYTVDDVLRRPR